MKLLFNSILLLLLMGACFIASAQSDSTFIIDTAIVDSTLVKDTVTIATDSSLSNKVIKEKTKRFQYIRVGMDLSKLLTSALSKDFSTLSFQADATFNKDVNLVVEGGYANSKTVTSAVNFTSNSAFISAGFDKNFFSPTFKGDKDNAFVGLRVGGAVNRRGEAQAQVIDPFFGSQVQVFAPQTNILYWIGLTAGFRLELKKNIFLGWNVRGKTFVNPKKIEEMPPVYLAGYGNAEKKPAFDYNFYLLYGFGKR